jgi:predicted Co/Zn/Cd cation transporter (cation efflux family)
VRALLVLGAVAGLSLGMLTLLLAALAVYLDRPDAVAVYGVASLALVGFAMWLVRRDRQARRARGELPPSRVPRQPIRLPIVSTLVAFVLWYALAVAVMRVVDGGFYFFDYGVVAPFAAFMLTTLTFAGRHIAFRLTAEEAEHSTDPAASDRQRPR